MKPERNQTLASNATSMQLPQASEQGGIAVDNNSFMQCYSMCACENKGAQAYQYVQKQLPKIRKTYNTTNLSIAAQNISDSAVGVADAFKNLTGTIVDSAQNFANSTFQNITGDNMDMNEGRNLADEEALTFVESNLTLTAPSSSQMPDALIVQPIKFEDVEFEEKVEEVEEVEENEEELL